MRIALLHYSAPPVVGGVESVLGEHARLLREYGDDVTVLSGANVAEIAQTTSPAAAVRAALAPRLAAQKLVVLHNVLTMPFHAGLTEALWQLADELLSVRFLAWIHDLAACNLDYETSDHRLAAAHPRIEYVAVSEHRAQQFQALTGRGARVIPNGVDPLPLLGVPEELHAFCREHRVLEREIALLHPTRLLKRKNVELSLRVLAALRAGGTDALLLVTGAHDPHQAASRNYATDLRALREELGQTRDALFLHDFFAVTPSLVTSCYHLADALFFPSRQEGFGLPILEAALHRLPIFCADRAPMNSLLKNGGHAFDLTLSADQVAALIARTLEACPAARARKEVVHRYSWEVIYRELLAPLFGETKK